MRCETNRPSGTVTIDSVLANSKTQNAFLFTVKAIFLHDYPVAVEPGSTPRPLVQKKTWRDSLPIDTLSAVSVLVVAQSSSEIPEGLMNNPVHGTNHLDGHQKCCHMQQPKLDDATCQFRTSPSVHAMDRSTVSASEYPSTSSSIRFHPIALQRNA